MNRIGPLLTLSVHEQLLAAARAGGGEIECSLDLERTRSRVEVRADEWVTEGRSYPMLRTCKERTIYYWSGSAFEPVSRYTDSLIKLIPTQWGAPTFEIDGIKMLPTAKISPYEDAREKVNLIEPAGKRILDTCAGLGYFAAWCLRAGAAKVDSFEKNPSVIWLRSLNPWSPENEQDDDRRLQLTNDDIVKRISVLPGSSFDAALHDPPRFGIAGELYSQSFYDQLARVLKPRAKLFHYTGTPNKLTTGRDVPKEVAARLKQSGFITRIHGDGVVGRKG
jgi:predicted methyltransferase